MPNPSIFHTLHRRFDLFSTSPALRAVVLLASLVIFLLGHNLLVREENLHVLAFLPVFTAGMTFGIWAGLFSAVTVILVDMLTWHPNLLTAPLADSQYLIVYIGLLFTGWIVGRNRAIFLSLQNELERRAAVEAQLRAQEEIHRSLALRAQRQTQEMALLDQVHSALAPQLDPQRIFQTVVEITARVFSYRLVGAYLVRDDFLILQHQVGYTNPVEKIPLGQGVMSRCVRTARPILVTDTTTDPDFLGGENHTTSEIAVPIRDHRQVIGVFNVESIAAPRLGEDDLRLMSQVTAYINTALERARLYVAEREQRALSEALYDNVRALNLSLQMDDVTASILTNLERVIPCDATALVLLDGRKPRIYMRHKGSGRMLEHVPERMIASLRDISRTSVPRLINDTSIIPGWAGDSPMAWVRSLMIAPVLAKDQKMALLLLGSLETHHFQPDQLDRVQVLAEQARVAIENARLFENLTRNARQLALLSEITGLALRATTLEEIYAELASRMIALIGADGAYLTRWDESAHKAVLVSGIGTLGANIEAIQAQPGERTLTETVLEARQVVIVEDSSSSPHISPRLAALMGSASLLGLPMLADSQKLGAVLLGFREKHTFTQEEITLAEQAAGQTALAINRLMLIDRIGQMAITDDLTGLLNYRGLQQFGQREVERALRFNRPLAGLMIDLDLFKAVNDRHGHLAGNQTLRAVARALQTNVRDIDIVGRYGGEEFLVLLPESDQQEARLVAERLRHAVESLVVNTGGVEIRLTISLGVAVVTRSVHDLNELVQRADQALYRAKRAGRNHVAFYPRSSSEIRSD